MAKDGVESGKTEGEWIYKENRPSICSDSGLYSFYTTVYPSYISVSITIFENKDFSANTNYR